MEFNTRNITCDYIENVQNWTDSQIADTLLYSSIGTLFKLVTTIMPIVFFVGVLGNVVFIWLVIRVETMRTVINFYLTNLAAADLLVLTTQMFFRLWRLRASIIPFDKPFGTDFGCAMYFFAENLSSSASIFLITLITLDRYFAICHPFKYHGMTMKLLNRLRRRVRVLFSPCLHGLFLLYLVSSAQPVSADQTGVHLFHLADKGKIQELSKSSQRMCANSFGF